MTAIRIVNEAGQFVAHHRQFHDLLEARAYLRAQQLEGFVATFTRTHTSTCVELFLDSESSVTTIMAIRGAEDVTLSTVPMEAEPPTIVARFTRLLQAAIVLAAELRSDLARGEGPTRIIKGLPTEEGRDE